MADASCFFFVINDVIMTSLLLLRIIYVLANFFDVIRDFTIYVSLYVFLEVIWILSINSTI